MAIPSKTAYAIRPHMAAHFGIGTQSRLTAKVESAPSSPARKPSMALQAPGIALHAAFQGASKTDGGWPSASNAGAGRPLQPVPAAPSRLREAEGGTHCQRTEGGGGFGRGLLETANAGMKQLAHLLNEGMRTFESAHAGAVAGQRKQDGAHTHAVSSQSLPEAIRPLAKPLLRLLELTAKHQKSELYQRAFANQKENVSVQMIPAQITTRYPMLLSALGEQRQKKNDAAVNGLLSELAARRGAMKKDIEGVVACLLRAAPAANRAERETIQAHVAALTDLWKAMEDGNGIVRQLEDAATQERATR